MSSSSGKSQRRTSSEIVPLILQKAVAQMNEQDLVQMLYMLRDWMADDKQPKELDYLQGRVARQRAHYGQPTPTRTDRDYQRDQLYETRLIELLDIMIRNTQESTR